MLEVILSPKHVLYDLLVALTGEGYLARQENVQDDSHGPEITLCVIVLVEDLRRNVVRLKRDEIR